jgi:hypothetical protein
VAEGRTAYDVAMLGGDAAGMSPWLAGEPGRAR